MSVSNETTTSTNATTKTSHSIQFDPGYLKTFPGLLKVAGAISSLAGFICVESVIMAIFWSHYSWSSFVFISGFCITLILILLYLFHIVESLKNVPWAIIEGTFDVVWTIFFFSSACIAAKNAAFQAAWAAASFFGFLTSFILGIEAFLKYSQWKSGDVAQGETTRTHESI